MNTLANDNIFDELLDTLTWLDQKLDITWSPAFEVHPSYSEKSSLNGRYYIALAAHDNEQGEIADRLCREVLHDKIKWAKGEPTAWFASARLANLIAWDCANHATGKKSYQHSTDECIAYSRESYEIALPFIETLVADQDSAVEIGEEKLINLLCNTYKFSISGLRGYNEEKIKKILGKLLELSEKYPNINFIRYLISFTLDSLVAKESNNDEITGLCEIALRYLTIEFESDGEDTWLVVAVGLLARLIGKVEQNNVSEIFSSVCELQFRWTDACFENTDIKYAIHHIFNALDLIVSRSQNNTLDLEVQNLVCRIAKLPRGEALEFFSNEHYIERFPKAFDSNTLNCIFINFYDQIVSRYQSNEENSSQFVKGFCIYTELTNKETGIDSAWQAIAKSTRETKITWLKEISSKDLLEWSPNSIAKHIESIINTANLFDLKLDSEINDVWCNALLNLTSAAFINNDSNSTYKLIKMASNFKKIDPTYWLIIISVMSLGEGHHHPEKTSAWADTLLNLPDPLSKEPNRIQPLIYALTTLAHELAHHEPEKANLLVKRFESLMTSQHFGDQNDS